MVADSGKERKPAGSVRPFGRAEEHAAPVHGVAMPRAPRLARSADPKADGGDPR